MNLDSKHAKKFRLEGRFDEKMTKTLPLTSLIFLLMTLTFLASWPQENIDHEKLIAEAEAAIASVDSYTAIFHKQERIKGHLAEEETIFIKFKRPFKVYMKWVKEPYKGRECLYIEGANKNRIKAHEGGILGLVKLNLNPLSSRAMKGNRHPITEAGLENLIKLIGNEFRRGIAAGEIRFKDHGEEIIFGRKTRKIETIFSKEKDYYCYRAVISLDVELKVPIKSMIYDLEERLIESYGYEQLRLNPGLTDADFKF